MGLEVKDEGPFSHSSKLLAEFKFLFGLGGFLLLSLLLFSAVSHSKSYMLMKSLF